MDANETPVPSVRIIPAGKRALGPNGKPRPELNKAGATVVPLTGALGAATKLNRNRNLLAKDPSKAMIEAQVASLFRSIRECLKEVTNHQSAGRIEKAIFVCGLIATKHNRIRHLQEQWATAKAADPVPETETARKPKTRAVIKPKRYSRFSDK